LDEVLVPWLGLLSVVESVSSKAKETASLWVGLMAQQSVLVLAAQSVLALVIPMEKLLVLESEWGLVLPKLKS